MKFYDQRKRKTIKGSVIHKAQFINMSSHLLELIIRLKGVRLDFGNFHSDSLHAQIFQMLITFLFEHVLVSKLSCRFFRSRKSYIVNFSYIHLEEAKLGTKPFFGRDVSLTPEILPQQSHGQVKEDPKISPVLTKILLKLKTSFRQGTCKANPAGENTSFIFTVCVKSVPLFILSLPK